MNSPSKEFDISDVLSVTTGALVSTRHMDGIYDIMGHVTGDPHISTIGLAMMSKSAKATILAQYPQLADVSFPGIESVPKEKRGAFIADWLAEQAKCFGKTLSIASSASPKALSLEDEIDFVTRRNPKAGVVVVKVGEPSTPTGHPGAPTPAGKQL